MRFLDGVGADIAENITCVAVRPNAGAEFFASVVVGVAVKDLGKVRGLFKL